MHVTIMNDPEWSTKQFCDYRKILVNISAITVNILYRVNKEVKY